MCTERFRAWHCHGTASGPGVICRHTATRDDWEGHLFSESSRATSARSAETCKPQRVPNRPSRHEPVQTRFRYSVNRQVHCLPIQKEAADVALRSDFNDLIDKYAREELEPATAIKVVVLASSDNGFSSMVRYARQRGIMCVVVGRFGRQTNRYQRLRGLQESQLALSADLAILFEDLSAAPAEP